MNKPLITTLIIGLVIEIGVIFFLAIPPQKVNITAQISPSEPEVGPEPEIILMAVGDIMFSRGVEYIVEKYGQGDFRFPFLKIANELQEADILFGNLEGPISERGNNVGSIYSFRFKPASVQGLVYAGFDILSLANNHMVDYTWQAFEDTLNILKENQIDYVGAGLNEEEAFGVKIKEIDNTKIGFLAYTNLGPEPWQAKGEYSGMAWIDGYSMGRVGQDIATAKQSVDILVVSLHAGREYSTTATAFQVSFANVCIDSGADIVIGHHSHVVQPVKKYRDGWIAYGLGNFVFDQGFSPETMEGLLLKVVIKNKEIEKVIPEKVKMNNYFQPEL